MYIWLPWCSTFRWSHCLSEHCADVVITFYRVIYVCCRHFFPKLWWGGVLAPPTDRPPAGGANSGLSFNKAEVCKAGTTEHREHRLGRVPPRRRRQTDRRPRVREDDMGASPSVQLAGGGTEGYHVLRVRTLEYFVGWTGEVHLTSQALNTARH